MNKKMIIPVLLFSFFFFSGCINKNNIFLQSLQKTAPDKGEIETSFAPVNLTNIEPYGDVLTTRADMPLYTHSNDDVGVSNCYESCAITWPPFIVNFADDVGGYYELIQRTDGNTQATYKGMPLYTYTPDVANKVTGDGKGGLWSVVVFE
jgi:predicted lipoprotein with Yx(FWY)xxD motif